MPKNTRTAHPPVSTRRVVRRAALAAAAIAVVAGGVVATSVVAQSAVADQLERRTSTEILNESTGMRAEQLAIDARILTKRTADAVAAAAAAKAAEAAWLLTPAGAQATAHSMAASRYGWGDDQFGCLVSLWTKESGWNVNSYNADSGATGIPQALPGEKMATIAADWQTNPATQIAWGLGYIASSYGTPCAAWSHSQSNNWY